MPIKEACHVAVQKNRPSKQKLWKHAQARQQAKGLGSIAVLQIVIILLNSLVNIIVFIKILLHNLIKMKNSYEVLPNARLCNLPHFLILAI